MSPAIYTSSHLHFCPKCKEEWIHYDGHPMFGDGDADCLGFTRVVCPDCIKKEDRKHLLRVVA